jgi:hypothetical protein
MLRSGHSFGPVPSFIANFASTQQNQNGSSNCARNDRASDAIRWISFGGIDETTADRTESAATTVPTVSHRRVRRDFVIIRRGFVREITFQAFFIVGSHCKKV